MVDNDWCDIALHVAGGLMCRSSAEQKCRHIGSFTRDVCKSGLDTWRSKHVLHRSSPEHIQNSHSCMPVCSCLSASTAVVAAWQLCVRQQACWQRCA